MDETQNIPPEIAAEVASVEVEVKELAAKLDGRTFCACGRDRLVDELSEPCPGVDRMVNGEIKNVPCGRYVVPKDADPRQPPMERPVFPSDTGPGGTLPLSDLRERLAMLSEAWVERYEDGPLRISFNLDAKRAHIQATQAPPTRDW